MPRAVSTWPRVCVRSALSVSSPGRYWTRQKRTVKHHSQAGDPDRAWGDRPGSVFSERYPASLCASIGSEYLQNLLPLQGGQDFYLVPGPVISEGNATHREDDMVNPSDDDPHNRSDPG